MIADGYDDALAAGHSEPVAMTLGTRAARTPPRVYENDRKRVVAVTSPAEVAQIPSLTATSAATMELIKSGICGSVP